ncbi:MAG: SAM-dependent chlorinase/fluorinase [Candidatus Sumerlaeaceae bacterium]|nr:SAM-dependent chlorinase/fluorinase [Candidatus Sumerlaeaceae bacterium]
MSPTIALLTDFGLRDWYVGTMKGVICQLCPKATIVDICHAVEPRNIMEGALMLYAAHSYFPRGTVFVAVVDPGVGTSRAPVVIRSRGCYFIGPNNGLFSFIVGQDPKAQCRRLSDSRYWLPNPSATFHGRDIFAPSAAHIAGGVDWKKLAPDHESPVCLSLPRVAISSNAVSGIIIHFDHFGNAITNIADSDIPADVKNVRAGGLNIGKLVHTFGDVAEGASLACRGSAGFLEIAVRNRNAREKLGLKIGDKVTLEIARGRKK